MHIFQPTKDLVQEKLDMLVTQHLIRLDNLRKISLHEIRDHVQFGELLQGPWLQDTFDREDVLVFEEPHDFELSECSKSENLMLKSFFNFFDGH